MSDRFRISLSERGLLILLALVQFTHIMDFMIMMPLGPQLMRELAMEPAQFSLLIAAYTMTAGVVGLLVAPFIDRFDRRVVLLVVYAGFIGGTLACARSGSVSGLIVARAICGAFGGVATATILTIAGDVVPAERRGAAMGMIMTAFSAAAALGVPFGLYLAQQFRWETPFYLLAFMALGVEGLLFVSLPSVRGHLRNGPPASWRNFLLLLRDSNAWRGLALMVSLIFGHFVLIPFFSPHLVYNMHLPESLLSVVYVIGGLLTIVSAPWIGRLTDRVGRNDVFTAMVGIAMGITLVFTSMGPTSLVMTFILTGSFFIFSSGRFVPAQAALTSAVPASRRGGYMSLVTCTRDFCSGLAAILAGAMVELAPGGLLHVDRLGWLAVGFSLLSIWLIRRVRNVSEVEMIRTAAS